MKEVIAYPLVILIMVVIAACWSIAWSLEKTSAKLWDMAEWLLR